LPYFLLHDKDMHTLEKLPTQLELAEKRYHDACDQAELEPCSDNDQWLYWSKAHYEAVLKKAAKREAEILKDLNSADLNQGRMPRQTQLSERVIGTVGLIVSTLAFGGLIWWLVEHSVVAK
jgi:hypothetical protein